MLSILILTLNEEQNLPACLESVRWSDDVVVLDSLSVDRTVEIARTGGARVFGRAFDDFAGQRNYALEHIRFKHPWVFHLDADERFTEPLRQECQEAVREDRFSGFMVPSKLMFMDRWLRHAGMYPTYQMRLLKLGEICFVQHGHGQREADAKRGVGKLREPYLHYNFSKGLEDWRQKHERYAAHEAEQTFRNRSRRFRFGALWSSDPIGRRRALKDFAVRMPCRPLLRFCYMYFLRLGLLDGLPGYRYCRLLASYERMITNHLKGMRLRERGRAL